MLREWWTESSTQFRFFCSFVRGFVLEILRSIPMISTPCGRVLIDIGRDGRHKSVINQQFTGDIHHEDASAS